MNQFFKKEAYLRKITEKCKKWGGPFTAEDQLLKAIHKYTDIDTEIIKNELTYYKYTHPVERRRNLSQFKVININHEAMLTNLTFLLCADDEVDTGELESLPTCDDVMSYLQLPHSGLAVLYENEDQNIKHLNELCGAIWETENGNTWDIGYIRNIADDNLTMEFLTRSKEKSVFWQYPQNDDIQNTKEEHILDIKVESEWDINDWDRDRNTLKVRLTDHKAIQKLFDSVMSSS